MQWVLITIFALLCSGLIAIMGVKFEDFINALQSHKKATLSDDLNTLTGSPQKGFFARQSYEIEKLLKATGRENKFQIIKRASLLLFAGGVIIALLLDNIFLVPILGIGLSLAPVWYIRSTASVYKKHLNEELETAISIVTTSYLRTEDILRAVKENLPFINPPVKGTFEAFVAETEMINANLTSALNTMKMKIPNQIFHEWCNTLIQCQSDRTMKHTLSITIQKFSDLRVVQSDLEAILSAPKREAITMMFLVISNIPLLYVLNKDWFHALVFTTPGKIAMALCAAIILFSLSRIMKLSQPVEYKG